MASVLVTAFDPYAHFQANSSWLCLLELTRDMPVQPAIVTRRYPVEFSEVRARLAKDLEANHDFALHLGQAPGSARIRLESIAVNVGEEPAQPDGPPRRLAEDGPVAYQSALPLRDWAARLREAGLPAAVSYHAGTYLCNATLYWTHYLAERGGLKTRSLFLHLPLDTQQALSEPKECASLSATTAAAAVRIILKAMEEA
ncbi:MAG: pyroglutamyl-peptidase I [Pirellulales bacterium]